MQRGSRQWHAEGQQRDRETANLFREIVVIEILRGQPLGKLVCFNKSNNNVVKVAEGRLAQVLVTHFGFCYEWPQDLDCLGDESLDVGHA